MLRHIYLFILLFAFSQPLYAAQAKRSRYVIRDGSLVNMKDLATLEIEEHFSIGTKALKEKDWDESVQQFRIICFNFPDEPLTTPSLYLLGCSYFHMGDFDMANRYFTKYLEKKDALTFFEETYIYKLAIAEKFKNGAKRHAFGYESMPSIFSANEHALEISDEIITALPYHEIAGKALFLKADLLEEDEEYKKAIEIYEQIIRQFPQTEQAALSYVHIATMYNKQLNREKQNPDLLALSAINIQNFKRDFPDDLKADALEKIFIEMQELFAEELTLMADFYERKSKPKAAALYYATTVQRFPKTKAAVISSEKLKMFEEHFNEIYNKNG